MPPPLQQANPLQYCSVRGRLCAGREEAIKVIARLVDDEFTGSGRHTPRETSEQLTNDAPIRYCCIEGKET